ncbi:MAG: tRNA (N6-threonylcarbamoyladenosine(37)-N6)-methyltransferase TrmO [Candidatus Aenigmatarchaeota archaeon]
MGKEISFKPIGFVSSGFKKPEELVSACEKGILDKTQSAIIIDRKFSKGIDGLERFSHLWVIYSLHKADKIELRTYPGPPSVKGLPERGVFATRSQYRPNKIALRLATILEIRGNSIIVTGLDAIDGSPVLDIKPYISHFDRPEKFREANWYRWNNQKKPK